MVPNPELEVERDNPSADPRGGLLLSAHTALPGGTLFSRHGPRSWEVTSGRNSCYCRTTDFMQILPMKNIRRFLGIRPLHLKIPWSPYPPHWRSDQILTDLPDRLGSQLKQQRLNSHLFQADVAKILGVSVVSVSNWERGRSEPSRRTRRRIRQLLAAGVGTTSWEQPTCAC